MFIDGLTNADAVPVLERSVQFAARRQELITHNIANLSTPNFEPIDVSVGGFRKSLSHAVDRRRQETGGQHGELRLEGTREVRVDREGLRLKPRSIGRGVLFHDKSPRDLERTMQDLAENAGAFRVASELLRSRYALLDSAIRQRP